MADANELARPSTKVIGGGSSLNFAQPQIATRFKGRPSYPIKSFRICEYIDEFTLASECASPGRQICRWHAAFRDVLSLWANNVYKTKWLWLWL